MHSTRNTTIKQLVVACFFIFGTFCAPSPVGEGTIIAVTCLLVSSVLNAFWKVF